MTRAETIQALKSHLKPSDPADLMNKLETMISDECVTIDDVADSDLRDALVKVSRKANQC